MEETRLLIVDDEPSILKSLTRTLAGEGLDILTAQSGTRALSLLESHRVDLIISDQRMPHMTGIEFLTRAGQKYPDIISMILTAYADIEVAIQAINDIGIYKFILKPWEEYDLKMTVDKAKRLSRLMKTNTILNQEMLESSDKTIFALKQQEDSGEKVRQKRKVDPLLEEAAVKGQTDYALSNGTSRAIDFNREEFDRLEYSAADLNTVFARQDKATQKKLNATVLDICYSRSCCHKIGADYNHLTGDQKLKVYKYALYIHGLI